MDITFTGKVAVVTGAASGIGKAIATAFAENGASVVLVDVDDEKGKKIARELSGKNYRATFIHADVSQPKETDAMAKAAHSAYKRIDILVNNAGVEFNDDGNLIAMPFDKLDRILQVNLYGAINCVRSVVPFMRETGGSNIINISSVQGFGTIEPGTSYQASKAGLLGLTRALAVELAKDGIRVNGIAPGAIATEGMGFTYDKKVIDAYRARIPAGRRGTPEEVAGPVLFLCSNHARYITGQTLVIDGGYLADITPDGLKLPKYPVHGDPDKK